MSSSDLLTTLPVYEGEKDKNEYRVMAGKVDSESFSTVIVEYPDKTVMLRTKGGNHQITVTAKQTQQEQVQTTDLIEKDYTLREYYAPSSIEQVVRNLKKLVLTNSDTPITFEPIPDPAVENDWYRFETIKTVDGIFDVVVPIAKKARYGFTGQQVDIEFVAINSFYTGTDRTVIGEAGLTFVRRVPVYKASVRLGGVDRVLVLKEPISTIHPIQAY